MNQLIKAGMLQYPDCVGTHHNGLNVPPTADANNIPERKPRAKYRGPWENPNHSWAFKTTLLGYQDMIKKAGSNLKQCVTEFGWPSTQGLKGTVRGGFEYAADNTVADQADFTDQAITEMQQWGFIRLAFLWNLNYAAQAGWNLQGPVGDNVAWSILGVDFQPRPVWQKIVDRNFRGQPRKAGQ
jgi:polysaccharide biosynthesis protein PslG